MSFDKRLDRIERLTAPPAAPMEFIICEPPVGLSREAHETWLREKLESGECFTFNFEAAGPKSSPT